jgi:hypothetical protein
MTARTGQLGQEQPRQDNHVRADRKGQPGQDSRGSTAGPGRPGHWTGQAGEASLDRTQRIVWSEHDSKVGQLRRQIRDMKP